MWILYSALVALVTNVVLGYFLFMFVYNGIDVFKQLYVSEEDATTNNLGSASYKNSQPPTVSAAYSDGQKSGTVSPLNISQ